MEKIGFVIKLITSHTLIIALFNSRIVLIYDNLNYYAFN